MKHNAWTKLLSLVLVMVMVLGVVPAITPTAEAATEITETGAIKIDFIDFVKTLKEDRSDIWDALRSTNVDGVKVIGTNYNGTAVTTAEYNAFRALQDYLDDEGVWNIAEGDHSYKDKLGARRIFLNTTDDDYGLRFFTDQLDSSADDRSKLILTVNAPAAGLYHMDLSVLNEAVTSKVTSVDSTYGRGHGDIYVNGELVYEDYAFKAYTDTVENISFGAVELKQGENTVTIYMAKDHFGTGSTSNSGRRACDLRSLSFIPLDGGVQLEQGGEMELDLRATYLPFDATVVGDTYTVVSGEEPVAKASFQTDGDLLITGYGIGATELEVYEGSTLRWTIPVTVTDPVAPDNGTDYFVGGFKAATFSYGASAEGEVTQYVEGEAYSEKEISLENGALYYKSNDTSVVTVDQLTGNITCVGEGSTTVIAYVLMGDVVTSDRVIVTVVDETDLASIEAYASVDYVSVGSSLQLYTKGFKASGSKADMSLYPMAWTVEGSAATVSETGVLTGVSEGTVTVTATAGVDGEPVSASMEIDVVASEELEENAVIFDFTYGRAMYMKDATLEEDGIEIDWANTYNGGREINYGDTSGIDLYVGIAGEKLALDFMIERDGWYQMELRGKSIDYAGVLAHAVVDGQFAGDIDFASTTGSTYDEGGFRNTIYLEAGKHDFDLIANSYGRYWLGRVAFHPVADPGTPSGDFTGKQTLVAGETAELELTLTDANGNAFYLQQVSADSGYTNWYTLTSSNTSAVTVSGMTMTAVAAGTSTLTMQGELMGETFTKTLAVTVEGGTINYAELSAESTTVKPNAEDFPLTLTAYGADGSAIALPSGATVSYVSADTAIASVSSSGVVTVTGEEGSVKITATITEGSYTRTAEIWISVTEGKTEPTIYTYEERANAQANAQKYTWAANMKNTAVKNADLYVENLEQIYHQWAYEGIPRATQVGYKNELGYRYCRYCGEDLVAKYGNYPYIVDPINNPWKITCPECKKDFPSNDFGAYYESGLNEEGRFIKDDADASLLTNDLYPEMGEGWGVDDGLGYATGTTDANGRPVVHTYIAYYMLCQMYGLGDYDKHSLTDIMNSLIDAYLYTGEDKYGIAGAILTDRIADIYPSYDITKWETTYMAFSDGGSQRGKIIGPIWDAILSKTLARSVDAFWPCVTNAEVIEFLTQDDVLAAKGLTAADITPEYLRTNAEDNILLEIFKCAKTDYYNGNFGMEEAGVSLAAVALDRLPETQEMFEWVFHEETRGGRFNHAWNTGGDVARVLTEDVSRDGFGYEVSYLYNSLWTEHLLDMADALSGYPGAAEYDLWNNPKFVNMYTAFLRLAVCGHLTPQVGEAGFVQSTHNQIGVEKMLTAYLYTSAAEIEDDLVVDLARGVYAGNGNSVSGLHGTIFMADPVDGVQSAIINTVAEHGNWNFSDSDMMSGFGIAILREGPAEYLGKTVNADQFFDYWMYFGYSNTAHARLEALAIDLEAFGLGVSSHGGYPVVVSSTGVERMQWLRNTASHNTVVVDDHGQNVMWENGTPLHFEDAGQVKIMDAEAPMAYEEADIYRRTLVTVAAENGVHYAVDFFRVLGGSEHVYSFHGATTIDPSVEGLTMVSQPFGTYAGADVPYGDWDVTGSGDASTNMGSGYSWLKNVSRDDSPETYFSIDWEIEDFHEQLTTSDGIHLKLHMLSEEPLTEVALAEGCVPQNGRNPEYLEYTMIRKSGKPGMDTLFTAIIEPYRDDELIASAQLLDVELVSGTEGIYDRAAAMKVTLVGGRQDYIIYATNPDCTYAIKEDGAVKLTFQGFAGVVSYNKSDVLTYAWGSEATAITAADGTAIIADAQASVNGTVTDFTEGLAWDHFITVTMDAPVTAEELVGRYIYVNNDGVENAAYRIHDAEVDGSTAVLNVNNQTLVREFVDASDMDKGYVYNISEGDTYTIPLSAAMTCAHGKNRVSYTTNNDGTHDLNRTCTTCGQITSTELRNCKDNNSDGRCDNCSGLIPQTISNAEELIAFAEKINGGTNTLNAILTADIDLEGYDWTPIGTITYPFKGVFTGAGYTISGMELSHESKSGEAFYLGLFANTLNATIKDLTVEGSIALSGTASGASRIGGIVGYAANTTLTGCINKVEITGVTDNETSGFGNVGGLVGYAAGVTILRCGNDADLIVTANDLGGLVGNVTSAAEPTSIRECYNHGDIFGYANVGGLVGNLSACSNEKHNNTVTDCYSSGDFETMTASGVGLAQGGGLIGRARSAASGITRDVVRNCYVSGSTTMDVRADGDYTDMAIVGTGNWYNITNQWQDLYYLEGVSRAETSYDIMMAKSHEDMLEQEFVDTLGSAFKLVEGRYPVLVWECGHPAADEICVDNGDGTHIIRLVCSECGHEEVYTEVCTDRDGDDHCDVCGGKLSVVDEITFAGANMTLGNDLKLNFLLLKSELDLSKSYTAVITKYDADGNVDETVQIPSGKWETYAGKYFKIAFGVAAKEMCDKVMIEIFDGETSLASYEDSVRGYAMRALSSDKMDDTVKTMMVDMLNYGAAAQSHFKYSEADLANSLLTDDQKALATASVSPVNKQKKIANCYGSNLSLDDSLKINMFFFNRPADVTGMYGEISFTNHIGEEIRVDLTEEDLLASYSTAVKNLCQVVVDEMVLADARQLITVTIYNADGTVYGACADSVESYVKRGMNSIYSELCISVMKFATSAYNYLHTR